MNCIDATQLSKMIDIPKFNKMINNTTEVATNFLNSYTEKQNGNKKILEDRNAKIIEERYKKTAMDKQRNMKYVRNFESKKDIKPSSILGMNMTYICGRKWHNSTCE